VTLSISVLTDRSLPSLPHPYHTSSSSRPSPIANGSPAPSQNGDHHALHQSIYHALQNGFGVASSSSYEFNNSSHRLLSPRMDEKGEAGFQAAPTYSSRERDGSPRLWGIELKWISYVSFFLSYASADDGSVSSPSPCKTPF